MSTAKTLEEVKRGYEVWHAAKPQASGSQSDLETPWYRWVRRSLPAVSELRVLEVACGRGSLVAWLTGRGARTVGCDLSEQALGVAKSHSPGRLLSGDIHRLPFADSTFDVVVSCETLEHTLDLEGALREMMRVARPGGQLLMTTPSYLNTFGLYRLYLWLRGRPYGSAGIQPVDRVLFSVGMVRRLRRLGLRIRDTDGFVHYLRPARGELRFIDDRPALRRVLRHFALHFMVHAEVEKSAGSETAQAASGCAKP
jgi:SAM-dependent methyltransferase